MKIELVEYREELKDRFRELNEEWLEAFFHVEPIDRELLSKPEETILAKGGCVYFALLDGLAVGTGSVIPLGGGVYELGKMAVTPEHQGNGIGRMLVEFAVEWTRKRGGDEVILYTSSKLFGAIALYRKLGFVETELGPTPYGRADVRMRLPLEEDVPI
ncbi:GNAT family N-acetyltransferase [Pelagicoccus mobilis]|uniref:GNAT family N-acetyltransferase n=1 Tax=Pelagicoccus mobilis TaxID=415221 RepID=A0A934VQI0_9BACT|nr:GNAT family N-acetyltransferase [Pelagicoccus mobilis]MBK1876920.1 GNAT family N-acetyltransferase [Pelagicoccus mobilis]